MILIMLNTTILLMLMIVNLLKYIIMLIIIQKTMLVTSKKCKHAQRHYRDRSKLTNAYNLSDNDENDIDRIIDLISRIHVYFVHSYGINRLTLDEINYVNEQVLQQTSLESDDDSLEDAKMKIITYIMNNKRKHLNHLRNDKYVENIPTKDLTINHEQICHILQHNNISISIKNIKNA
eukprot:453863_1